MKKNTPFLLKPAAKDYIWGGNRINTVFSKNIEMSPLAETWECSVHPDGLSVIADGPFAGRTLKDVLDECPDLLGRHSEGLPILIKFIDAENRLSVQVHPDDEYAERFENGSKGKTECWVIIDAKPGAKLVFGLREEMSREDIISSAADGSIESRLNYIPVAAGDVIPVPAGTVHAIGAGILLAEIQQNSNLTYRLYDWGRVGKDGKPRELHAEKAADVIKTPAVIPVTGVEQERKYGKNVVCSNECFTVERIIPGRIPLSLDVGEDSFGVLLCTSGSALLGFADGETELHAGDCVFIPAGCGETSVTGDGELLLSGCPINEMPR